MRDSLTLIYPAILAGMGSHVHFIGETMSEVKTVSTIASFVDYAKSCTVVQLDTFKKVTRGQSLDALAGAHVRTDSSVFGQVASLYSVSRGIVDTLSYGQKTRLTGFAIASKRIGAGFTALVALGVTSDAGDVLLSIDPTNKGKESAKQLLEHMVPFMAKLWAERSAHAEAEREAKKAEREAKKAEASTLESVLGAAPDMATPATPATPVAPSDAVAQCIALIQAGLLSESDMKALMSAINAAPIQEAATVLALGYTPVKKARKARKPKATA